MTKDQFKRLKKGNVVISNIVPTITFVVEKKCKDGYVIVHTDKMTNPEAWDLIKEKKCSKA
jgi:hypothetical protein